MLSVHVVYDMFDNSNWIQIHINLHSITMPYTVSIILNLFYDLINT